MDLSTTTQELRNSLQERAKIVILKVLGETIASGELLFLSGLGVDGNQEMLDALIKACKQLKKEMRDE